MLITFLGTAAANAYPEAFCSCANCVRARKLGGPNLRKRTSAMINDDLLIDLGPDIMTASQIHGRPLTNVRYCLQTHPHADHLDTSHFLSRSPAYGVKNAPRLHFYASAETLHWAAKLLERDFNPDSFLDLQVGDWLNLELHTIRVMQRFEVGPYSVVAFPANHDNQMGSLLFAIEADGSSLFYGTDTAVLAEDVWKAFRQHKLQFDVVILDHTYGPDEPGSDHLSAHQVVEHATRMRAEGIINEHSRVFGTHIAHEGNPVHHELMDFASSHGYEIAYDGLAIEF